MSNSLQLIFGYVAPSTKYAAVCERSRRERKFSYRSPVRVRIQSGLGTENSVEYNFPRATSFLTAIKTLLKPFIAILSLVIDNTLDLKIRTEYGRHHAAKHQKWCWFGNFKSVLNLTVTITKTL